MGYVSCVAHLKGINLGTFTLLVLHFYHSYTFNTAISSTENYKFVKKKDKTKKSVEEFGNIPCMCSLRTQIKITRYLVFPCRVGHDSVIH